MTLLREQGGWVSMALVADASVGEKALSAKEWLSQRSASQHQHQLPLSSMKKSASRSKEGVVSAERANETILFSGMNLAHVGSVEVVLQALDVRMGNDIEKREDGIPPLSSSFSPLIKSKSPSRSSSSFSGKNTAPVGCVELDLQALDMPMGNDYEKREDGFPPLTPTCSPLIKSKSSKSSSHQANRDGGVPPLTSTCSPLIKSKSSKSSSNPGSLQGLVVAPDGVTLVKDRRKCKPRGVLTVGVEMSSFDSDDREEEAGLAIPSPSVATVEWVHEGWNDTPSTHQSHADELHRSCSTVTSKSVRSPRMALNFDFHQDSTKELGVRDEWSNIREVVELRPKIVPRLQESYDVRESVEGRPADLIFADSDVSFRPELAHELLPSGKDYSVSTSSSKEQHHVGPSLINSPQKRMFFSDLNQSHYIRQSLQLELQDDVNDSPGIEIGERPCAYSSDMIPDGQSETQYLPLERVEAHQVNPEKQRSVIETTCPLPLSPSLPEPPENEGAHTADIPLDSLTVLADARRIHVVMHKHEEGSESCASKLSPRLQHAENHLSPEELVAETLYQLAAENLKKTRTGARRFKPVEGKKSPIEAASSVSIVKQSVSSVVTSRSGEHATRTDTVPYVSPRISRQVNSSPELAKVDLAQPLRTIVLSCENDFSQEFTTLQALIGNVHVEARNSEPRGLPATIRGVQEEVNGTDQLRLAFSRKAQRQCRQLNSGYYTNSKSSFRKAQQHRRLSCDKRVSFGSILAATAAFGFVVISIAMGSCQHCYKSNHYQYYIRPT